MATSFSAIGSADDVTMVDAHESMEVENNSGGEEPQQNIRKRKRGQGVVWGSSAEMDESEPLERVAIATTPADNDESVVIDSNAPRRNKRKTHDAVAQIDTLIARNQEQQLAKENARTGDKSFLVASQIKEQLDQVLIPSGLRVPTDGRVADAVRVEVARFWNLNPHAPPYNPAPNPVSIIRSDLTQLEENDYVVTEKSDGVRYLLILTTVKTDTEAHYYAVMMDRACRMFNVSVSAFPKYFSGSVFDGELVKNSSGCLVYNIFDVVAACGKCLRQAAYSVRMAMVRGLFSLADEKLNAAKASLSASSYVHDVQMSDTSTTDPHDFINQNSMIVDGASSVIPDNMLVLVDNDDSSEDDSCGVFESSTEENMRIEDDEDLMECSDLDLDSTKLGTFDEDSVAKYLAFPAADRTSTGPLDSFVTCRLPAIVMSDRIVSSQLVPTPLIFRAKNCYRVKSSAKLWRALNKSLLTGSADNQTVQAHDGLIFTPIYAPVGARTHWTQFKWKPQHTIDLQLKLGYMNGAWHTFLFCADDSRVDARNAITHLPSFDLRQPFHYKPETILSKRSIGAAKINNNNPLYSFTARSFPEANASATVDQSSTRQQPRLLRFILESNEVLIRIQEHLLLRGVSAFSIIVECTLRVEKADCSFGNSHDKVICNIIRIRDDKTDPNSKYTLTQTLLNVEENVSLEEIVVADQKFRISKRAQKDKMDL